MGEIVAGGDRIEQLGQAEVEDLGMAVLRHHDVVGVQDRRLVKIDRDLLTDRRWFLGVIRHGAIIPMNCCVVSEQWPTNRVP